MDFPRHSRGVFGARRFESFRSALRLPRATLTERLKRLTYQGIFRQVSRSPGSSRLEYRLTQAGLELYPRLHGHDAVRRPVAFRSQRPAVTARPRLMRLRMPPDPGLFVMSGASDRSPGQLSQRSRGWLQRVSAAAPLPAFVDSSQSSRGRPSSVSRTLEIIGDRWSFLIIREAFLGARRFERLQNELRIASNI